MSTFSDPLSALESIKAKPPGILITDVKMKGMNGLELLDRTKVISDTTEVIIITGYSSADAQKHHL